LTPATADDILLHLGEETFTFYTSYEIANYDINYYKISQKLSSPMRTKIGFWARQERNPALHQEMRAES
jgi:hypothetical protein